MNDHLFCVRKEGKKQAVTKKRSACIRGDRHPQIGLRVEKQPWGDELVDYGYFSGVSKGGGHLETIGAVSG